MDYIVFGTGYGATLLVLGWYLRTFGPGLRYRDAETETPARADELVHRMAWTRFASALGTVIATAGAAIILVTFLTGVIDPGNHVGGIVLWICFLAALVGIAVWMWLFVARFGMEGLLPEQLDIGRLFAKRDLAPSREQEERAPAFSSSPRTQQPREAVDSDTAGPDDELDAVEDDDFVDDPDDFESYGDGAYDDESELEIRYSRYQVHHPDEPRDDAYRDLFAMYGEVEIEPESGDDGHYEELETAEDEPEIVDEVADADHDAVVDESVPDDDQDGEDQPEEVEAFDPDTPLTDTPEGRAEALRRLQAWQPDDND